MVVRKGKYQDKVNGRIYVRVPATGSKRAGGRCLEPGGQVGAEVLPALALHSGQQLAQITWDTQECDREDDRHDTSRDQFDWQRGCDTPVGAIALDALG